MLADLLRLVLLILFLPIILIFIGPLLILAVVRGYQPMGPITLDTTRYSSAGRVAAWVLGMVLWLVVWGGLIWFAFYAFVPPTAITAASTTVPTPATPLATPTSTPIPPTSTLVQLVELTALPATGTPAEDLETLASPTSTPVLVSTPTWTVTPRPTSIPPSVSVETSPTATPTPTSTPTLTSTPKVLPTMTSTLRLATATVEPSATATGTAEPTSDAPNEGTVTSTVFPQATLTLAERAAVVEVVKAGNILLQEAIAEANEENLQNLATIWRGLALQVARNFATHMSEQYAKPMVVEFEYLEPPSVDKQSIPSEVTVTSQERWAYGGPTQIDREEVFNFIYTLTREDEGWIISRYTYRNVPPSGLTPTKIPSPTPKITPSRTPAPAAPESD